MSPALVGGVERSLLFPRSPNCLQGEEKDEDSDEDADCLGKLLPPGHIQVHIRSRKGQNRYYPPLERS